MQQTRRITRQTNVLANPRKKSDTPPAWGRRRCLRSIEVGASLSPPPLSSASPAPLALTIITHSLTHYHACLGRLTPYLLRAFFLSLTPPQSYTPRTTFIFCVEQRGRGGGGRRVGGGGRVGGWVGGGGGRGQLMSEEGWDDVAPSLSKNNNNNNNVCTPCSARPAGRARGRRARARSSAPEEDDSSR